MKLGIILLVIIIILGVITFWYWHKNISSKEILKLEILGDDLIEIGKEVDYLVKLKNNGKVRLENLEMNLQVPSQTILNKEFNPPTIQKIEALYPGEEKTFSYKMRFLGRENENVVIRVWTSYQFKGLTNRSESETTFTSRIKFLL